MERRGQLKTTPERSRLMRAIREAGTEPERVVRKMLNQMGVRYRVNCRGLPGRPDISNQARGFVIFVHGCFWHRHPRCHLATLPKSNRAFWLSKFMENRARDRRAIARLKAM